jgi:GntR family transcriptional regulator
VSEPFYRRIISDIRGRIASGQYPPGERLPTTERLRDQYRAQFDSPSLTNATVRHAVSLLIELGELRGQQGLGVFVPGVKAPD